VVTTKKSPRCAAIALGLLVASGALLTACGGGSSASNANAGSGSTSPAATTPGGETTTGTTPGTTTPDTTTPGGGGTTPGTSIPAVIPTGTYPWPTWTPEQVTVPPSTTGLTYYVDGTRGSDTNTGRSATAAFRTIARTLPLVQAGDTVLIRAGLYYEGINAINTANGAAGRPITFGAYGDGEVILDGSTKVTGWTRVSGSLWRAPVTVTPIAVVLNEVPLKQTHDGVSTVTAGSGRWFYDSTARTITADMGGVDPNAADIVVPKDDPAQTHVYFYGKSYYTFKGLTVRGSGAGGIWGYGDHITVERCNVKFNGKGGIVFQSGGDSLDTYNSVLYTHVYHNVLNNWPRGNNGFAESGGGWSGGVGWSNNRYGVARGNVVHMNGGEGIISYGTTVGVKTGGDMLFEQNVAYDNWSVNMYFDNQGNNTARSNILFNHPIDTSNWLRTGNAWPWNELYKYSVCLMLADEENSGTGTHANLDGSRVYNNLIAGCRIGIRDYSEGANAYRNHGLRNTVIANNTIIMPPAPIPNTGTVGIFLMDNTTPSGTNRNSNTLIQNNVIVAFSDTPLIWAQNQNALAGITLSNNVYHSSHATPFRMGWDTVTNLSFAGWVSATQADAQSRFSDPLLVNAAGFRATGITPYAYGDAAPRAGSPALGAGTPQSVFSTNLLGQPRQGWSAGAF
jgi:hypothetical protein